MLVRCATFVGAYIGSVLPPQSGCQCLEPRKVQGICWLRLQRSLLVSVARHFMKLEVQLRFEDRGTPSTHSVQKSRGQPYGRTKQILSNNDSKKSPCGINPPNSLQDTTEPVTTRTKRSRHTLHQTHQPPQRGSPPKKTMIRLKGGIFIT